MHFCWLNEPITLTDVQWKQGIGPALLMLVFCNIAAIAIIAKGKK